MTTTDRAPQQRRTVLVDLREIARYNRGVINARAAYAEHPFRTDARYRQPCSRCFVVSTDREGGVCLKCERAAT